MHEKRFNPSEAYKLEDPDRLRWLPPDQVLAHLNLEPGMIVTDIGSGTGYFALPMARAVGSSGKIFAVDVSVELLDMLRRKLSQPGSPLNIHLVEGEATKTNLADGMCDWVFLANVWHEVDDHGLALVEISRLLRSHGRVAILDWRPDVTRPPGPPLEHRIAADRVGQLFRTSGWPIRNSVEVGQYSYLVIAEKPSGDTR